MKKDISDAMKNGVRFLCQEQDVNGSFKSLTSKNKSDMENGTVCRSIFSSSLILSSINNVKPSASLEIAKKKLVDFLLGQKSRHWSFNYWERGSADEKRAPYPDDLDDTFCSLAGIHGYDPKVIKGGDMAKIVSLLTAVEDKEGGPYRTWLVPDNADKAWKDVDLAVNSNIGFFLSREDIYLDSLISLVEKAAGKMDFSSPYYASPYSVIYFISRFYNGKSAGQIADFILSKRKKDGSWGNILDTALAVSALSNFEKHHDIAKSGMEYLIDHIGLWKKPYPFVVELIKDKETYYSGASALTMAFVLEAISKYCKWENDESKENVKKDANVLRLEKIHGNILDKVSGILSSDNKEMNVLAKEQLNALSSSHYVKNITLLAYNFSRNLSNGKDRDIKPKTFELLGAANVLGWMAYSIYDDFYDNEGDVKKLPLANICLLDLVSIFESMMASNREFLRLFNEIMAGIDQANYWEIVNCRMVYDSKGFIFPKRFPAYGDYSKLAERSMGHMLGPAAILFLLGYGNRSSEVKNIVAFFHHYIIAKQFNDDAHDYEEDIRNGRLTPTVVSILKKWNKNKERSKIDIKRDMKSFQSIFWHDVVIGASEKVLFHCSEARKCSQNMSSAVNKEFFESLLESEERPARSALEEQRKAVDFIKSMGA